MSANEYPYVSGRTGRTGNCSTAAYFNPKVTIGTVYSISSELSMKDYVLAFGPVAVYVSAGRMWQTYSQGILTICSSDINHAVQVVGVRISVSPNASYWKLR